jgi:hypothetical protein
MGAKSMVFGWERSSKRPTEVKGNVILKKVKGNVTKFQLKSPT